MDLSIISSDLAVAVSANPRFSSCLVLYRNANSDLLSICKESSADFFSRIFSSEGPFWKIYSETGTGHFPSSSEYLSFIAGRMYFCMNMEKKCLSLGGGKELSFENGRISEKNPPAAENLLLKITSPINILSDSLQLSLLPLFIREKLGDFSNFRKAAVQFHHEHSGAITDYAGTAAKAMDGAVASMEYSFASSLAASFKVRMPDSDAWKSCEAEQLSGMLSEGLEDEAASQFGFYSPEPYDLSAVRFHENPKSILPPPFPRDPYARWRENSKFLCMRYLGILRGAYLGAAGAAGMGNEIFHLRLPELPLAIEDPSKMKSLAKERLLQYEKNSLLQLPNTLIHFAGKWQEEIAPPELSGTPAGAALDAEAEVVFINTQKYYPKKTAGKIILSRTFSPSLASLLPNSKGIISETGGVLSHTAIIARELSLPCIVQLRGSQLLKEGMRVKIDGKTGKIFIIAQK
ncbi:MAG: PEP-utilizing enzyme [Candidatus Micrarchaeota archaeon]